MPATYANPLGANPLFTADSAGALSSRGRRFLMVLTILAMLSFDGILAVAALTGSSFGQHSIGTVPIYNHAAAKASAGTPATSLPNGFLW